MITSDIEKATQERYDKLKEKLTQDYRADLKRIKWLSTVAKDPDTQLALLNLENILDTWLRSVRAKKYATSGIKE